jgi:hypothetical protein
MPRRLQFRRVLPLVQTAIVVSFGGWGLWLRDSALNSPFFDSTLWNTTARFHVWPWPYKFAVIQNTPVFLLGLLPSLAIDTLTPGLPEWVQELPSLLLVPALWYLIGAWLDRTQVLRHEEGRKPIYWPWILLCFFTTISLLGALSSGRLFGSYTSFIPFGVALWIVLGIAVVVFGRLQKGLPGAS